MFEQVRPSARGYERTFIRHTLAGWSGLHFLPSSNSDNAAHLEKTREGWCNINFIDFGNHAIVPNIISLRKTSHDGNSVFLLNEEL